MRKVSKRKLAHAVYNLLCRSIKETVLTITLFSMPSLLAYIIYYLMFSFSAVKVFAGCLVIMVMIYTNMKM